MGDGKRAAQWPAVAALVFVAGCQADQATRLVERVEPGRAVPALMVDGLVRSAKPRPLAVPGDNWSQRRIEWIIDEGSTVEEGELIARFGAPEAVLSKELAAIDVLRNLLERAAKEAELDGDAGQLRADLTDVLGKLAIAQRYADADLTMLARNEILDALDDQRFLNVREQFLAWQEAQARSRGESALAVVDAARAGLEANQARRERDLEQLELRAPGPGVVLLVSDWGGLKPIVGAMTWAGSDFALLPDTTQLEVEFELPEVDAAMVRAGWLVEVYAPGLDEPLQHTTVSFVASAAKTRSRNDPQKVVQMRAELDSERAHALGIKAGQTLRLALRPALAPDALTVPALAVQDSATGPQLTLLDGRRLNVELGARMPGRVEVRSGLEADQWVVVDASSRETEP